VWAVGVVVIGVLTKDEPQMPFTGDQHPVRHSRRALPIQRSAMVFARGASTGVATVRTPMAVNTAPDAAVNGPGHGSRT
jgi:hypothetical protein